MTRMSRIKLFGVITQKTNSKKSKSKEIQRMVILAASYPTVFDHGIMPISTLMRNPRRSLWSPIDGLLTSPFDDLFAELKPASTRSPKKLKHDNNDRKNSNQATSEQPESSHEEKEKDGIDYRLTTATRSAAFNVQQDDKAYMISCELPGVPKDNIKVELVKNRLTISGETSRSSTHENVESSTSMKFMRSFAIDPSEVDTSKISAKMENGLLQLTIPKQTHASSQIIEVH